jgi:uridine monophosphate synthetase
MQKIALIKQLYAIGAVKTGQFTLKSGLVSPIYIDLRLIISYPELLRTVSELLWQKIQNLTLELLCGVPYTALPIATCLSLTHQIPMVMRRKEPKDYGTKKLIEGVYHPGQACMVIEDVVTSGMSILETVADLTAVGLKVEHACALIDRGQGGAAALQAQACTLHTVISLQEILNVGADNAQL